MPRDRFLDFITAHHLYNAAILFCCIAIFFVALIYMYLYRKKANFRLQRRIAEKLDEWIGEALLEDADITHTYVTSELQEELQYQVNRQFVIDRLISTKKNLTGQTAGNISRLYEQLDLHIDSLKKFRSRTWYKKARGIYELYMMDQRDSYDEIAAYTNSDNKYIRQEAQTATISFAGFDGLVFLSTLTYPLTEWQQLKILEQLKALDPQDMKDIPVWLSSENNYVVLFALRLTEIYYQLNVYDAVAACLQSTDEKIRKQAIITLGKLANEQTPALLAQQFEKETAANKRVILQQLAYVGDHSVLDFLRRQLENENDLLKLESARAFAKNFGLEALHAKISGMPETYGHIYKHVKYELRG